MSNGILMKSWEVHCQDCEQPALGLAYGKSVLEASAELREMGWQIRGDLWRCPDCKDHSK